MMWRAQASVVLSMLMLAACFGGNTNGPKTPSGSPATTATALSTQSAKFFREREVQGDVATGSLWALFYHRRAGEPVKTIWRMTGTGDLSVEATGPGGQTIQPDGSPRPHGGSNWPHPGDEWGIFWTIPRPGRWTFDAKRGDGPSGTVTIEFS